MGDYADAPPSVLSRSKGTSSRTCRPHGRLSGCRRSRRRRRRGLRCRRELSDEVERDDDCRPMECLAAATAGRHGQSQDASNFLGVDPRAVNELDPLDQREPPNVPGEWVALAFRIQVGSGDRDPTATTSALPLRRDTSGTSRYEPPYLEQSSCSGLRTRPSCPLISRSGSSISKPTRQSTSWCRARREAAPSPQAPRDAASIRRRKTGAWSIDSSPSAPSDRTGCECWRDEELRQTRGPPGSPTVPPRLMLDPASPNPFNSSTRIRFGIPRPESVSLAIYTVRGDLVSMLLDGEPFPRVTIPSSGVEGRARAIRCRAGSTSARSLRESRRAPSDSFSSSELHQRNSTLIVLQDTGATAVGQRSGDGARAVHDSTLPIVKRDFDCVGQFNTETPSCRPRRYDRLNSQYPPSRCRRRRSRSKSVEADSL